MPDFSEILNHVGKCAGVTSDSQAIASGGIFVAIRGNKQDGHDYIGQALQKGARWIVGTDARAEKNYAQVPDSRLALAELAAAYYRFPADEMLVLGVTGTSGKTTTTYLLESILTAANHRVGVIGTVAFRSPDKTYPSSHTTPDPVQLQKLLREMRGDGCTAVVMEVSSHALAQHRAHGIAFDGVLFTNLTPEHLDFHADLEAYFGAKSRLFFEVTHFSKSRGKNPVGAIHRDDEFGAKLYERACREPSLAECRGFFTNTASARCDWKGIQGHENGVDIRSPLIGKFNLSNILGALYLAQALKIPNDVIAQGIARLQGVPGRMESCGDERIHVLVDYAHKPDALEKVLVTLQALKTPGQRIITVFGCGGDRDQTKRPVMGRTAAKLSDHVVVTSDNPRTEDPRAIIDAIVAGTAGFANVTVEADRRAAIHMAIRGALPGDLVLIAGKGHEDYQIIGKEKRPFDDRAVAREALRAVALATSMPY